MEKNPEMSVIMPMYNAENIVDNLKDVIKDLDSLNFSYEIILVNDGSTNNCYEEAKKFKDKRVRVECYKKNQGKGNALKYGLNFAKGEYVAFLDSGGDLDPKQLKNFLRIMNQEKADIVVGSKRHPESKVYYPLFRKIMSKTYRIVNKILFNLDVKDTQVGIKLFKKGVLKQIMPKILVKRFAFDLEVLVVATKLKFKIVEAPIVLEYQFKSTINPKAVFLILLDTAAILYRLKILRWYDKK